MYVLLLILHLLICLGLVGVVLIQSGKGGGLAGGAFGGSAQTVFGGRGATDFITRATMVLGGAFFVTSLVLALLSSGGAGRSRSLIQDQARQAVASHEVCRGGAEGQEDRRRHGREPGGLHRGQRRDPRALPRRRRGRDQEGLHRRLSLASRRGQGDLRLSGGRPMRSGGWRWPTSPVRSRPRRR